MKWPGQELGKVPEHGELTMLLLNWLSAYATKHPGSLLPEHILVSLERCREIITEVLVLKRPFPARKPPVERKRDLS